MPLKLNNEIPADYLDECKERVNELISISNDIIVYDLIKGNKEKGKS